MMPGLVKLTKTAKVELGGTHGLQRICGMRGLGCTNTKNIPMHKYSTLKNILHKVCIDIESKGYNYWKTYNHYPVCQNLCINNIEVIIGITLLEHHDSYIQLGVTIDDGSWIWATFPIGRSVVIYNK